MTEFDIIEKYFKTSPQRADVILGSGDDCAILAIPPHHHLAVTTDTLVSGVHFPANTTAYDIGYKAVAVNLSDLAAMGATPAWLTATLTLPEVDETWLTEFCAGFFALLTRYNVQLVGGDLTRGPLSVTVQAHGFLPVGKGLKRSGAQVGDGIYVSGTLGDAGLALQVLLGKMSVAADWREALLVKLNRPEPQIGLGEKMLDIASAAIDISDGLSADLSHILKKSQVGATLDVDCLPLSSELLETVSVDDAIAFALSAGDDYELCFTVPALLENLICKMQLPITRIGIITDNKTLALQQNGKIYHAKTSGYRHF